MIFRLSLAFVLTFVVNYLDGASVSPIRISLSNDDLLYGSAAIGTPAREFNFMTDTSSPITWIMSSDFDGTCHESVHGFNRSQSSTYEKDGRDFEANFLSCNMTGFLGRDVFKLSGVNIINQTFGETMQDEGDFICMRKFVGSFGLGLRTKDQPKSLVENLFEQNLISAPIVSLDLIPREKAHESGGEILFGGINSDKFSGELSFIKSSSDRRWEMKISQVLVKDSKAITARGCENGCSAAIESSPFSIYGPLDIVRRINEALDGKEIRTSQGNIWKLPCQAKASSLKVVFTIDGKDFSFGPEDYIDDPRVEHEHPCYSIFAYRKLDNPSADWILGSKFMRKFYTVLDFAKKQIGFAEKNY